MFLLYKTTTIKGSKFNCGPCYWDLHFGFVFIELQIFNSALERKPRTEIWSALCKRLNISRLETWIPVWSIYFLVLTYVNLLQVGHKRIYYSRYQSAFAAQMLWVVFISFRNANGSLDWGITIVILSSFNKTPDSYLS